MNDVYTIKEFQKKNRKKHVIFICDHASNFIPKKYNLLGLTKNHFNKTLYWQAILEIFNKIEDQNNGKKIIIASHMRRNINDQPIKRKFIFIISLEKYTCKKHLNRYSDYFVMMIIA